MVTGSQHSSLIGPQPRQLGPHAALPRRERAALRGGTAAAGGRGEAGGGGQLGQHAGAARQEAGPRAADPRIFLEWK